MDNTALTVNDPSDVLGRWIIIRGRLNLKTVLVIGARFEFEPGVTAETVAGEPVNIRIGYEPPATSRSFIYKPEYYDDVAVGAQVTLASPEQIEAWVRSTDAGAADDARPLHKRASTFIAPAFAAAAATPFAHFMFSDSSPLVVAAIVVGAAVAAWAAVTFGDTLPAIRSAEAYRDAELGKWAVAAGEQWKLTNPVL